MFSVKNPIISVVIPFYNIDQYVRYCLDSILRQSFPLGKYEVICIDDGSVDGTGAILDEYASRHNNCRVVHTENQGLSAARNEGVKRATGGYITFVDGDDFVSPYYLELLYGTLMSSGCGLAIGRHVRVMLDESKAAVDSIEWKNDCSFEVMSRSHIVSNMLYDNPMISSWAHLAPKELYESSPFPDGKVYEDSLTFGKHVACFDQVAVLNEPVYAYVSRPGSITSCNSASLEKILNFENAVNAMKEDLQEYNLDWTDALIYHEALERSRMVRMLYAREMPPASQDKLKELLKDVSLALPRIMKNRRAPLVAKARLALLVASPKIYLRHFETFQRVVGKVTGR